jgi:hypothetical protein
MNRVDKIVTTRRCIQMEKTNLNARLSMQNQQDMMLKRQFALET